MVLVFTEPADIGLAQAYFAEDFGSMLSQARRR
jgi:hypothetical protein